MSEVKSQVLEREPEASPASSTALVPARRGESALVAADPLARYLSWIREFPVLPADEQMELARAYKATGERQSATTLLRSNLRLVVKIAYEYRRRWVEMLELIQEGNLGLVEAIERFDPLREVPFTSYAQYWIRAYILRYVMDNFRAVRLSSTRAGRKLFWRLGKERAKLEREGFVPTTLMLAERTGVTEQEILDVSRVLDRPATSLDAPTRGSDGESGASLGERLPDEHGDDPEMNAALSELREKVQRVLRSFEAALEDPREQKIFQERLVAETPVPLREMGARMGISRERVRQLESRLREQLAKVLRAELGEDAILDFVRGD
ncbi:MAG: sigma-70 family RNA polymerase sigma factor [Pseudomonadota bacterium]